MLNQSTSHTNVVVILDRSGSMDKSIDDTIGGYNTFLRQQTQKIGNDEVLFSLHQFDHEFETVYQGLPPSEVPQLTRETYVPRGSTALYDAIGRTLNSIRQGSDQSMIVVILTDGHENASREYNCTQISELIHQKKELGWEFVYLGANQDAILSANKIGIGSASSMTYKQDSGHIAQVYTCLSQAVTRHRASKCHPPGSSHSVTFEDEERQKCDE